MSLWTWEGHHPTQKHRLYYTRAHQFGCKCIASSALTSSTLKVIHLADFALCTLLMALWTWQGPHPTQNHQLHYPRAHQNSQKCAALSAFNSSTSKVMFLSLRSLYASYLGPPPFKLLQIWREPSPIPYGPPYFFWWPSEHWGLGNAVIKRKKCCFQHFWLTWRVVDTISHA